MVVNGSFVSDCASDYSNMVLGYYWSCGIVTAHEITTGTVVSL